MPCFTCFNRIEDDALNKRVLLFIFILVSLSLAVSGCCGCGDDSPDFTFEIQASPATFSTSGEMITFTYIVKNPNADMTVNISDASGAVCGPLALALNATQTCQQDYFTTAGDVGAAAHTHTATASGQAPGYQDPTEKTTSATVSLVPPAIDATFPWWIPTSGCDEGQFYFVVETGMEWLIPEWNVAYTATDGNNSYNCVTEAPGEYRTGRIYCTGARHPASPACWRSA